MMKNKEKTLKRTRIQKILLSFGVLSTITIAPIALTSCFEQFFSPSKENKALEEPSDSTTSNKEENNGSFSTPWKKETSNYNESSNTKVLTWDPPTVAFDDGGVAKVWHYMLNIPKIVELENEDLIKDVYNQNTKASILKDKIIEKYQWFQDQVGQPMYYGSPKTNGLHQVYNENFQRKNVSELEEAKSVFKNELRLFYKENPDSDWGKNVGIAYLIMANAFLTSELALIQLDFFYYYAELQKFLYSINDLTKTVDEQLLTKDLPFMLEKLKGVIERYLNPINHYSTSKTEVFVDIPKNSEFQEFYNWLIKFSNKTFLPLYFKVKKLNEGNGYEVLEMDGQLERYMKKYFYPLLRAKLEENWTSEKIEQAYKDFISSNSYLKAWLFKEEINN